MKKKINSDLINLPKRETAVDIVINGIKKILLSKQLLPGDRLPIEMELANNFSVSRGSVREALKILSAFGIVEIVRGDGTYIAKSVSKSLGPLFFSLTLSNAETPKLIELREMIELGIVRIVINNADDEDLKKIEEQYLDMKSKIELGENNPKVLTQCDINFHHMLGRATKNELIAKIYDFVIEYFAPSIEKIHSNKKYRLRALHLHRDIIKALKTKELNRAEGVLKSYDRRWVKSF